MFDGELRYDKIVDLFCGTQNNLVKSQSNVMIIQYRVKKWRQSMGFLAAYSQGK